MNEVLILKGKNIMASIKNNQKMEKFYLGTL